jgi:lipoyl(octanoyl) transferase
LSALPWHWLGRLDYRAGTAHQRALRDRLLAGDESARCLLLLEHTPVITLGRNAQPINVLAGREVLAEQGIEVVATERGGDVTYHGPGQLMVYPAVVVRRDIAGFLAALAGALGEVATQLGVPGARWQREPAGLWLPDLDHPDIPPAKLAACGVHLRRGAVLHGMAFNVSTPPSAWRWIVPCGLRTPVTSLAEERARRGLPPPPSVAEVAEVAAPLLCDALERVIR